jgi:flagellar biosynthesis/type III secretory pathway protein FliH
VDELENHFEKWMYVIKNLKRLDDIPDELRERIFEKMFAAAEVAKLTYEEYIVYLNHLNANRDWNNCLNTAIREATEKATKKATEKATKIATERATKIATEKANKKAALALAEATAKATAEGLAEGIAKGLAEGRTEGRTEAEQEILKLQKEIETLKQLIEKQ